MNINEIALGKVDGGGVMIAIFASEEGKVIVNFGCQLKWVGMSKKQAMDLAAKLVEIANELPA